MTGQSVHIAIDVHVDGEDISGHAGDGVAEPKRFSGWLGLIGALDALLAATPRLGVAQQGVRMCLGFASAAEAEAFAGSPALREALSEAGASGTPEVWVARESKTRAPWPFGATRSGADT